MKNPHLTHCVEMLGGLEGIQKVMQAFYHRQAEDTMIGFFFKGKNIEDIAQRQSHFFLSACSPASCKSYKGKPPQKAHQSLPPILPGHFDRRMILLKETLDQTLLEEPFKKAWIQFEASFRKAIVKA